MVCFAVTLVFAGLGVAEIPFDDAVGIWLFDEGKGEVAKDISKEGNDGKLIEKPKWVNGQYGGALEFDGKTSCVDTEQKLLDNLEQFTIVCWVNPLSTPLSRTGLVGQNDSPEFGFITAAEVNLWTPTAGGLSNPYKHKIGEWHHVAAVADGSKTKVYIDGTPVEKPGPGPHGTSGFNVHIGGCGVWDPTGNFFHGQMDEVAIFHTALDDDQIKEIMNVSFKGILAVEAKDKLPTTWGKVKVRYRDTGF
jgi:hypothetical protein